MSKTQAIDYATFITYVAAVFAQDVMIPVIGAPVNSGLIDIESLTAAGEMGAPKLDLLDISSLSAAASAARTELAAPGEHGLGMQALYQFAQSAGVAACQTRQIREAVYAWSEPIFRDARVCTSGYSMVANSVREVAGRAHDAADALFRAVGLAHTLRSLVKGTKPSVDSAGFVVRFDDDFVFPVADALASILNVVLAFSAHLRNPGTVCRTFGDVFLKAWVLAGGSASGMTMRGVNTLAVRLAQRTTLSISTAYAALVPYSGFPGRMSAGMQASILFAANNPKALLPDFMANDLGGDARREQYEYLLALDAAERIEQ